MWLSYIILLVPSKNTFRFMTVLVNSLGLPPGRRPYGPEAERANSTMKEDLKILEKPRILNAQRAAILAQMAAIVLLLHRAFKFVVKTTILFTKLHQTDDPAIKDKLYPPSIPKSIRNLIQLE